MVVGGPGGAATADDLAILIIVTDARFLCAPRALFLQRSRRALQKRSKLAWILLWGNGIRVIVLTGECGSIAQKQAFRER